METEDPILSLDAKPRLGNFLSGMETEQREVGVHVVFALETSLVEWKPYRRE